MIDEGNDAYYTIRLPNKTSRVYLWGHSSERPTDEVMQNPPGIGFNVVAFSRISRKVMGARIDMPVILFQLPEPTQNTEIL